MSGAKKLSRAERKAIQAAISRAKKTDKKEISAQDSIPYLRMRPDGICRVTETHFTKTIQFRDINYQLSSNEDKQEIFDGWCDFLNYFDSSVKFQLSFVNLTASQESFAQSISIPPQGDDFDSIRTEYAEMLQNQLARGNNGLVKTKYLTFGIDADSLKAAKPRLERIETDLINNFKRMGVSAQVLNGHERLQVLHDILRMDTMEPFRFSWDWLAPTGLSTKDFIAPSSFNFKTARNFMMGKKYASVSYLQILAPELSDRILKDFLDIESNIVVNLHIMVDRKQLKNPNGLILGTPGCFAGDTRIRCADESTVSFKELVDQKAKFIKVQAYDTERHQYVIATAKDIRIERYADELFEIELLDGSIVKCTPEHLLMDRRGNFMQAKEVRPGQLLSGRHMAVHVTRKKLLEKIPVYDMSVPKHLNFVLDNGLVVHNSGKSFSAKREISNAFLVTQDDIIICDPEGEYAPLVERLGGQVIKISPTSPHHINPMDLNLNYSDDDNPLSLKSDFILSLCELIVGGKEGLAPVEKTIIDRCVRLVYQQYMNNPRPENMPILEDLYNKLREQTEKEAQYIATALEIYVTGSLSVFNNRTNVNIKNRVVCYDIRELGKQLKKIGMHIVQDQVWNRVTENRFNKIRLTHDKDGEPLPDDILASLGQKATRYYMDEFHLLLKEEQTAAYSVEIWKRFRKWGGIPTGITQNVKDLLSSREVENIFENSDFIYMLNQAPGDRQILAKHLGISPHQLSYVTHSSEGEGLLFYGNTIIPFVDHFPKDTELYQIMTTKPQEVKEG